MDVVEPKVSVIMITYNHEMFIAEAIEGVLMQEVDFPIELIIADDCSLDGTEAIVQKFIKEHPKGHWIKYTKHKTNKGMMPNFIWALEKAQGNYIALCEGDDYWTDPNKIEKQVKFLELNKKYVLISHNVKAEKNGQIIKGGAISFNCKITLDNILKYNMINTLSVLFLNCLDEKDRIKLSKYQIGDWPIFAFVLQQGCGFLSTDYNAVYRIHNGGAWSSKDIENEKKSIEIVLDNFKQDFKKKRKLIDKTIFLLKNDYVKYSNLYSHLNFFQKNKLMRKIYNNVKHVI
jgi:glycosyltransferase involved in cell wall biosynthesis